MYVSCLTSFLHCLLSFHSHLHTSTSLGLASVVSIQSSVTGISFRMSHTTLRTEKQFCGRASRVCFLLQGVSSYLCACSRSSRRRTGFQANRPVDRVVCVNRSDIEPFSKAAREVIASTSVDWPRGLNQFGNMCYLNSFLRITFCIGCVTISI